MATNELLVNGRTYPVDLDEVGAILLSLKGQEHVAFHGDRPMPDCRFCTDGWPVSEDIAQMPPAWVKVLLAVSAAQNEDVYDPDAAEYAVSDATDVSWSFVVDEDDALQPA